MSRRREGHRPAAKPAPAPAPVAQPGPRESRRGQGGAHGERLESGSGCRSARDHPRRLVEAQQQRRDADDVHEVD